MNAYKCDRCGEYHLNHWLFTAEIVNKTPRKNTSYGLLHICPKCMAEVGLSTMITASAQISYRNQYNEEHPDDSEETIKEEVRNEDESVNC